MKKFIFALIVMALPMTIQAQSEGLLARKSIKSANADLSTYAAKGAVPEVDGKIVFKADILAPGKTKEDLYQKVAQWASYRYSANSVRGNYTDNDFFKNLEYATVKSADKNSGRFQCQVQKNLSSPLSRSQKIILKHSTFLTLWSLTVKYHSILILCLSM